MRFARRFAIFSVLSSFPGFEPQVRDDAFFEPINVCCAEGDGGAGGGAGGGASDGGGAGGGAGGDAGGAGGGEPKYVTVEDMGKAISGALTSHSARLRKEALDPIQTTLRELSGAVTKLATPKEPEPNDQRSKQPDPETLALKSQLEELKQANAREREAREKAETKQRDDAARNQLKGLLEKGLKPEYVEIVTKSLFDADRVVTYDENGKPLFKSRRPQYVGGPEEDVQLTLEDGVSQFLKSKSAEPFRPAPTTTQKTNQQRPGTRLDPQRPQLDPSKPLSEKQKLELAMEKEQRLLNQQS